MQTNSCGRGKFICYNTIMRNLSLLLLIVLFCACSSVEQLDSALVGGERDAHGCITSAGYTYSQLRRQCLRPWEEGIGLSAATTQGVPLASGAYVLLSDDGTQAELFWALGPAMLLPRSFTPQGPYWQKDGVRLERQPQGWKLYKEERLLFQADNPPAEAN